ncbi:MAG TPA: YciI family protein [Vicinamibacterales bacterium]|nr:YciI family protein [Vicinamibacterales bacterium]
MRFAVMHKTNAHWESGAIPSPELIARVGALLGGLAKTGALLGAEGLRASSEGVRLRFAGGTRTVINGPFEGDNELPAAFSILRMRSLEDAIEWATRQADVLGPGEDVEIDIRPVTEPWDIGMVAAPADVSTRRYMVLRKATPSTEAGGTPSVPQRKALARLIDESTRGGTHIVTEAMRPSRRGRRYKNSRDGVSVYDGPFIETKELLAGYVIVAAASLEDAGRRAMEYLHAVEAGEVDVRELE